MENTNAPWYKAIVVECNSLAEKFGLDDMFGQELRDFVIRIARDQYKVGNSSGIAWLKRQQAIAAPNKAGLAPPGNQPGWIGQTSNA